MPPKLLLRSLTDILCRQRGHSSHCCKSTRVQVATPQRPLMHSNCRKREIEAQIIFANSNMIPRISKCSGTLKQFLQRYFDRTHFLCQPLRCWKEGGGLAPYSREYCCKFPARQPWIEQRELHVCTCEACAGKSFFALMATVCVLARVLYPVGFCPCPALFLSL
jgi:hypothetical protein